MINTYLLPIYIETGDAKLCQWGHGHIYGVASVLGAVHLVRTQIFRLLDPSPFVSFLARSIVLNPRNLPYYVRVWAFPHPPGVLAWWKPPPRSPINYPEYYSFLETSVASSPAQLALPLSFPPQRLCTYETAIFLRFCPPPLTKRLLLLEKPIPVDVVCKDLLSKTNVVIGFCLATCSLFLYGNFVRFIKSISCFCFDVDAVDAKWHARNSSEYEWNKPTYQNLICFPLKIA